ncbi:hypothetical protein K4L44_04265 [Halosquirtibacter laminarini]|uniref:Uncharacterized protein n=1 Tax=Halosquirtibacter laminarini TaxID=3374600 RepID=A0AC61NPL2_9BACT|nr:hypothetical protein K4L44_04265 [Prolixibacteraceae bacterium]
MKDLLIFVVCVFASLTGLSSFNGVDSPVSSTNDVEISVSAKDDDVGTSVSTKDDVEVVKETLDETKLRLLTQEQKLMFLEDRFFERLDGAEARINAEIRGQQKQLDSLRGLMHMVLSFLIGLSGFLIYEKRGEKRE